MEKWEEDFEKRMPGLYESDKTPYRLGHVDATARLAPVIEAAIEQLRHPLKAGLLIRALIDAGYEEQMRAAGVEE